jgi:hypothetical protein
MNQQLFLKH